MRLYTCVITHRHGTDVFNDLDPKRLTERLYEYVVSNWEEVQDLQSDDDEVPEDMSLAIEMYFARHHADYYEWPEEDLEPPPCTCGKCSSDYHADDSEMCGDLAGAGCEYDLSECFNGPGWYMYQDGPDGAWFVPTYYCEMCGGKLVPPKGDDD